MLIFLDLETTGVGANDKICSIALLSEEKHYYSLINEQKKIPAEASAVHHITNEDIKEAPAFTQSAVYDFLKNKLGLNVKVIGIEMRENLIELCNSISEKCGFTGLSFIKNNETFVSPFLLGSLTVFIIELYPFLFASTK